jgi:hypothetical protein
MRADEDTQYSTEFLSPARSPKKRLSIFGRNGDSTIGTPKQSEKRPSIFQRKNTEDSDSKDEGPRKANLNALLSPRLEKRISQNNRRKSLLSPLSMIRPAFPRMSSSKNNPDQKNKLRSTKKAGSDDEDDSDDDEESDDEVEKVATDDDMLLLLCRELELITGDSDEEYDEEDEDEY